MLDLLEKHRLLLLLLMTSFLLLWLQSQLHVLHYLILLFLCAVIEQFLTALEWLLLLLLLREHLEIGRYYISIAIHTYWCIVTYYVVLKLMATTFSTSS